MALKHSQILRTIHLLITVCLLGQIAVAQESVAPGCDPNQWAPLAPPSGHWVFNEQISVQTKLVTIEVTVVDVDEKPVSGADVLAYCEPWDFTKGGNTDASGRWRVVGPIGDWSFFAAKSGSILACSERIAISADTLVTLDATDPVQIRFVNPDGSPFAPVSQGTWRCLFTPTSFPSAVGTWEIGYPQSGKTPLLTTPQVSGILTLMGCPTGQTPGYVVFQDFNTHISSSLVVDGEKLGCVRFQLDGLPTCETWWNLFFEPVDNEVGRHHVWVPQVPSTGKTCEIRITPGLYRISAQVCRAADWAYPTSWVPVTIQVEPNSVQEIHFGGTFEARLNVILWNPASIQIWVDILDNHGQFLTGMSGTATLKLTRGSQVLFEGPMEKSWGQYVDFGNPLADDMRQGDPIQFEYEWSSPVMGPIKTSGVLPQYEDADHDPPSVAQSRHFELHSPHPAPYADEVLGLLECCYDWLVQEYSGPFSPQTGERFVLLDAYGPYGGGSFWDVFGTDLYYGYCQTGGIWPTGLIFHEFGHTCMWSLLANRGLTVIEPESLANLIATYLTRVLFGERAFRSIKQYFGNPFFDNYVVGVIPMNDVFPLLYIDARYGQAVNRDFFRAVWVNERNLGTILETADFLTTETERRVTLYSYLARDNLAWLYRWAGLHVTDEIVDQGVAYIKTQVGK